MIEQVEEFLQKSFSHFLIDQDKKNSNIPHFYIKPEGIVPIIQALKEHKTLAFQFLNDLTAVDWLGTNISTRFEVLYLLKSPKNQHFQIQLRVPVEEGDSVPSITSIFKGANWPEREVYDLFGIEFLNHPYMERILLPDNFVGYPLRKDYPLEGPGQDYLIENLLEIHTKEDITEGI
ncbi:NADH-quinone oxidoreductase subunit C [Leptospira sp. GIMC2001]|uniref:NADH-quinone oxidoreductase subunit C n=1 Tax=Leptospira sp. GIMC2001 TaxID=1513297 RepID=UPI002349CDF4|nr:NADH-quinone oxidoreductase subunit C [Leptospira sp. GIMC2001]WCL48197.1 NADH-quinone oxidoreductase subunit C [Leptospira sp. GIMC2001]